jgi:UDP-N-acetylglucosamine 2-epimerase (non-hydrolysing)
MKKNICLVFGTRPEAIKMAPVYLELKKNTNFNVDIIVTGQHKEMLYQVLDFFDITPTMDLSVMKKGQDLFDVTISILDKIKTAFEQLKPDLVLVHGDTTTTFSSSLAAFYLQIPVGHVEAGLRTHNKYSPFPEELNRSLTGRLTEFHFSPTKQSRENLLLENIDSNKIIITGNTVIDALFLGIKKIESNKKIDQLISKFPDRKIILITGHRRENHGDGFVNICKAIHDISKRDDVHLIYPVHLNPNVQEPVYKYLDNIKNISLIDPLEYESFIYLMNKSTIILTDSGGIQEEAPSLGIPVLVMRDTTERPEAVEAGTVKLVGTDKEKMVKEISKLLDDKDYYKSMSLKNNPYGDGTASVKINDALNEFIKQGQF